MKTNKAITILLTVFLSVQSLTGQKVYNMEDCKRKALENNLQIQNAENRIQMAEQLKKTAFTKYFPTINATGFGFAASEDIIKVPLLPKYLELSMLDDGIVGSINAVQVVFAGGRIVNANKLSQVNLRASELQGRLVEKDVLSKVEEYYWQIIALNENEKTLNSVEDMLRELKRNVKNAVEAGITKADDLLLIEMKENEIASKRISLENGRNLYKRLLAQSMGEKEAFDIDTAMMLSEALPVPSSIYTAPENLVSNTPEYILLQQNVEAKSLAYEISRGKLMPTVTVGANYNYNDILFDKRNFGMIFVGISIPLSDYWGGSYEVKQEKLGYCNALNDMEDKSALLTIRLQKAFNDLNDAYLQIDIAQKTLELSSERLRLNENYYNAGTVCLKDLLEARTNHQQSRDAYVHAIIDYKLKYNAYLRLSTY